MNTQILARDAAGNVVLTAEQALQIARWKLGKPARVAELHMLFDGDRVLAEAALAAWVERWAITIAACEVQA